MDIPQLHAIGFDAPTIDEIIKKAFEAGVRGVNEAPGFTMIGTYSDPSGARLAFIQREGQAVTTTAALASATTYRAQVVRFTDVLARVALYSNEGEGNLLTQYLAMVDDPFASSQHDLRDPEQFTIADSLHVGALAIDVQVFADEDAYLKSPASKSGSLQLGTQALMSPGLVGLQAGAITPAEATPTLLMAATIESVEVRTNTLTGVQFQCAVARSAATLTCAIPMDWPVEVGNIVFGTWYATCSSGVWDED